MRSSNGPPVYERAHNAAGATLLQNLCISWLHAHKTACKMKDIETVAAVAAVAAGAWALIFLHPWKTRAKRYFFCWRYFV